MSLLAHSKQPTSACQEFGAWDSAASTHRRWPGVLAERAAHAATGAKGRRPGTSHRLYVV